MLAVEVNRRLSGAVCSQIRTNMLITCAVSIKSSNGTDVAVDAVLSIPVSSRPRTFTALVDFAIIVRIPLKVTRNYILAVALFDGSLGASRYSPGGFNASFLLEDRSVANDKCLSQ